MDRHSAQQARPHAVEALTVMLVDDEPLALETLKTLVDWEALGFRIVAACKNGKEGLRAFASLRPEVAFVDIDMPLMNGIQLLQEIRAIDQNAVVVILSAHSKFEYAQKAVSAGALDYIIKEDVTAGSLAELLGRINRQVETQHKERAYLLERYVGEVFNSPDEEYMQMMEDDVLLQRRFANNSSFVLCELDTALPIVGMAGAPRFGGSLREAIRGFRKSGLYVASIGMVSDTRLALELALEPGQEQHQSTEGRVNAFSAGLQAMLREQKHRSVSVFTTRGAKGLYHAARQYQRHRGNIFNKYLLGTGLLLPIDDKRLAPAGPGGQLDAPALYTMIEKWEYERAIQVVQRAVEAEKKAGSTMGLMHLFETCVAALLKYGGEADPAKVLDDEAQRLCVDADGICAWVTARLAHMAERLESSSDYSREVRTAVAFIRAHYAEPALSNQRIAEHSGLSASHMGYLFKKETGRTMVDYITEMRIEAAKALLQSSGARVYQVAEQVGYSSSQYFSQVFFRLVGCKPIEYQKRVT